MFGYWLLIGVPIVLSFMDLPKKNLNPSLFMFGCLLCFVCRFKI